MVYKGHVENGRIVMDDAVELPEGAAVVVEFVSAPHEPERLHPDLERFTGIIPPDIDARAEYHDSMRKKHL